MIYQQNDERSVFRPEPRTNNVLRGIHAVLRTLKETSAHCPCAGTIVMTELQKPIAPPDIRPSTASPRTYDPNARRTRVRHLIVFMLFFVTTLNYADRAAISITGTAMQHSLDLSPVAMGYIFSAFAWSYVIAQLPGGWLLDRFGSKRTYAASILTWSILTMMQGWVVGLSAAAAVVALFTLRFLVGAAEAPAFPGNSR